MKRKNKRRKLKKFRIFLLIILFLLAFIFISNKVNKNETVGDIDNSEKDSSQIQEETTSMSLIMVGDN